MSREAEIVVIGGGPAGCASARLLAMWGRKVLLLTREEVRSRGLGESLPPSTRKLFTVLGISSAMDKAGFLPAHGNMVWWPGDESRVEKFEQQSGWQVERTRLDTLLRDLAREAGADVRVGYTVERVAIEGSVRRVVARVPDDWQCSERLGKGESRGRKAATMEFQTPLVLDCSGRAGVLASDGLRVRVGRAETTALVGVWRSEIGWSLPDETLTLVEAYRDGWAWSIPVDDKTRYVTAMIDPAVTALREEGGIDGMYRGELDKTVHLARLMTDAQLVSAPSACSATPYAANRFAGPGFLLVGDAGSFIDPLSSYGVKKALASGWRAAIVANTILDDPTMEEAGLSFFEARERAVCQTFFEEAAKFYAHGEEAFRHPFWNRRSEGLADSGEEASDLQIRRGKETSSELRTSPFVDGSENRDAIEDLRKDPGVLAAFERLRQAERVCLRPAGPVSLTQAPVVRGRRLVFEDRLQTRSHPDGLEHLRGIDMVRLVRLARETTDSLSDVPGLYRQYQHEIKPIPLPDFLGALSVLLAEGVLENTAELGS